MHSYASDIVMTIILFVSIVLFGVVFSFGGDPFRLFERRDSESTPWLGHADFGTRFLTCFRPVKLSLKIVVFVISIDVVQIVVGVAASRWIVMSWSSAPMRFMTKVLLVILFLSIAIAHAIHAMVTTIALARAR